ncbi:MAG: M28 family peptidase [Flavobacteriaceae bacterium]|nr:M28 family peptidase [Flavobacteriaceae bacterium]
MKKGLALLLIIAAIYWSFFSLLPSKISNLETDKKEFSTERALVHLEKIAQNQHPVGSQDHAVVRDYIIEELKKLELKPEIQEGYTISKWGNLVKAKNVLARIKGTENTKALLILTHYDSAPHSSFGASDAGSGIVAILESVRAFLNAEKPPKNDIIILFTDAEELGLNGADLFVNKHDWAKDVGLVLNFEARGSGGPSYMLVETNGGNSKLINGFVKANPKYPVANSLAYSIYKMLPNDTDLTRFREDGDIDGFNFAFIDDHFDYHTSNDTYERLDKETLEHQGMYLMSMLNYFSQTDLSNLKSNVDYIYFNVPLFKIVSYPFAWIWPMLIVAIVVFVLLLFVGFKKRRLLKEDVIKGWMPLLLSLFFSGVVGYLLWKLMLWIYPEYSEMLHGFTYNGHTYIVAFVFITLGVCFYFYSKYYKPGNTASLLVAPIILWIVICIAIALKLQGASFYIIPVFFALISLFVLIRQRKPHLVLMALLCFPVLSIMSPFVKMFPVGLGLKMLFISCILTVLIFVLLISVFGFFKHKRRWSVIMHFIGICFLISAHFNSSFTAERQKPNSLVYVLDIDTNKATWATYDTMLDNWTENFLGQKPRESLELTKTNLASKYNTGFKYASEAPFKPLLYPEVEIYKDTVIGEYRELSIKVKSIREADRIDFFSKTNYLFKDFKINGVEAYKTNDSSYAFENRKYNRLFTYYIVDHEPLKMEIRIPKDQSTKIEFFEASNDLLTNRHFTVQERGERFMPKPFILNDAIILKKTINIE